MSANYPEPTPQEPSPATTETQALVPVAGAPRPEELNLADEFREFGRGLAALLRVVRESPRAKEVETQVTQTMKEMERQVNDALAKAKQRAQEQNLGDTLKGAAQTAADETQRSLARGLHMLNERMAETVQEAEKKRAAGAGSSGFGTAETPADQGPTDTHYDPGL